VPVLAIGGVTAGNVAEVLAAGAAGVVVRSGIGQASAAEDAHALRLALDAGPAPPAVLTRNLREVLACASA
jgi:thiamine monophosphate synthase